MLRGMSRLLPSAASSDAFHIVHCPLEVPEDWLHKFDFIDDSATRQTYHAMVAYMDQVQSRPHISKPNFFAPSSPNAPQVVGNVTTQIRAKGSMWQNTLIVMSSDNVRLRLNGFGPPFLDVKWARNGLKKVGPMTD